jgi:hypothetical protein
MGIAKVTGVLPMHMPCGLMKARSRDNERIGVPIDRDDRADDRQLVEHPGIPREVLADLDAWDIGYDRPELAAVFCRRFGLKVVLSMWQGPP